jgi:diguanylate cyclase (GGDEF)-like protein
MSDVAPHIDLLSGAWKRDHFEAMLGQKVAEARRLGQPLALLWIDVDDLHEHNDVHGRASLDLALGHLATQIAAEADGAGPLGRMAGGAYAIYLPGWTRERAARLSERIRVKVPKTLHASAFGDYRLTVSVGVAMLRKGEPFGNFLEAAEEACTRAKQGGRDLVVSR